MLVPARAVVLALSLMLSRWAEPTPQRSMWVPLTLRLRPVRPPTLAPSPRLPLFSLVSATDVVSGRANGFWRFYLKSYNTFVQGLYL